MRVRSPFLWILVRMKVRGSVHVGEQQAPTVWMLETREGARARAMGVRLVTLASEEGIRVFDKVSRAGAPARLFLALSVL